MPQHLKIKKRLFPIGIRFKPVFMLLVISGVFFYSSNQVMAAAWTTITQRQGVITNDENNTVLSSHTAKIGQRLRVMTQVDTNSGTVSKNLVLKLQYDKNDNTWVDVAAGNEIRPAKSSVIGLDPILGTGVAGSCTGGVTKEMGHMYQDTARTTSIRIGSLSCQDVGFVVDTKSATVNTTYRFRLYDLTNGAALNTYSAYASFATVSTSNDTSRFSASNVQGLSTTQNDLKTLLDNQGYSNINTDDAAREMLQNVSSDTTADITITGGGSSTKLGTTVSSAGDVNGDGYDDIVVTDPEYSFPEGRAFVYYGGPNMSTTPSVTLSIGAGGFRFGYSASAAGDVNGDGYDDVIVGSLIYAGGKGRADIFYGGSAMDGTSDINIVGGTSNDNFGNSVSATGDVNGDGYDDVIVGAYSYTSSTGQAYVFYGGSSMNNTADVTMTGGATGDKFGISVAGAGDVNGDGYKDVVVGASVYSSNTGRAYVFYGGSSMDNTADVTMTGGAAGNAFGVSVAGAGDVNGDGYQDVIVGASWYTTFTGRAYVFYGGSSMDNTADVTMTGGTTSNYFGNSVSTVGDVNGDGYADVIVGAYGYTTNTGRAYIYYGGSSMDSTADVTMTGGTTSNYFGSSVSSAGDVNGDGYADIIVGAYGYSTNTGRAYIYYQAHTLDATADATITGAASSFLGISASGAGDVNGDGYADVIVGAIGAGAGNGQAYIYYGGQSLNATIDVTLTGGGVSDQFGISVSGAGDVNGDGYADVIVGASGYSSGGNTGRSYIFYGGSSMDSTADVTMTGGATSNNFGNSVASAGDVNSDGYADVVVGAVQYSSYTGRAYIFYGGSSMDSTADVTMTGGATGNYFGISVNGAGDLNGDGYSDVVVGAYAYSTSTGRAYVYYGGSAMDNTADVTMTGAVGDGLGSAVGKAGDVNGDGYDDLVIGAMSYSTNTGRAYIYLGGSSMDNTSDLTMTGGATGNIFGSSVAGVGDLNSDGYADIAVGAANYSTNTGRAYVYYGSPTLDNTADLTMTGGATNNYLGRSVAAAGDMNGDGQVDLLISAYGYSTNTGRAYIYEGGSTTAIPTFTFASKHTATCTGISSLDASWNGQSNAGASTKNILLQVYRFGSTNAWSTITTNSSLAADTDGTITGSVSTNLSEYCDGSNWSYWRVYQASGTQTMQSDYFNLTFTGGGNTLPDNPSTLVQNKVTGGASVSTGGWTNENQIRLSASATDPDASDTLQLCVESKAIGTAFTGTGEVCGTGVAYSGSSVTTSVDLTSLAQDEYHWQARLKDAGGLYSSWVSYGGNAESARDFGVDTTAPTGTVYDGSSVGVDATLNNGALDSLSANWATTNTISGLSGYEYSIGTSPSGTSIKGWTSVSTSTSVTASSLSLVTSQAYYFNVRTTDNAGNTSVISSNGMMVSPSLTFSTSASSVDFGALNAGSSTASQSLTLTTSTNAQNGYKVYGKATDYLKNQSLQTLAMFNGGSYASPAAWGSSTGFGYNSSDTLVGGVNRFNSGSCLGGGSAPCFAPYSLIGIGDIVADHSGAAPGVAIVSDAVTISNKVTIDSTTQQAGKYQTTVLYSAYATY